jgi:hypothetical protein
VCSVLDRQSTASSERPGERVASTMMPTRTSAPRMIHSQMRLKLDPLDAAGELLAGVAGGAVLGAAVGLAGLGVGEGGAGVGDGGPVTVAGALSVGGELVTAPLAFCTHAAARHPVARMAAASSTLLTSRRMPVLPRV